MPLDWCPFQMYSSRSALRAKPEPTRASKERHEQHRLRWWRGKVELVTEHGASAGYGCNTVLSGAQRAA